MRTATEELPRRGRGWWRVLGSIVAVFILAMIVLQVVSIIARLYQASSWMRCQVIPVSMQPGATPFTRMPCGA